MLSALRPLRWPAPGNECGDEWPKSEGRRRVPFSPQRREGQGVNITCVRDVAVVLGIARAGLRQVSIEWNCQLARSDRQDRDTLKFPVPDFVVEVLPESTEENDRRLKFEDYAAHGVNEYWIVDPKNEAVEKYVLKASQYNPAKAVTSGEIKSDVIAGFAIPIRAIFEAKANRAALRRLQTRTC